MRSMTKVAGRSVFRSLGHAEGAGWTPTSVTSIAADIDGVRPPGPRGEY